MKFNYKLASNILIYLSVFFVLFYILTEYDYKFNINMNIELLSSVLVMIIGYIISFYGLFKYLNQENNISFCRVLEAESLSIFNKYIPGKIWSVVGPIVYMKKFSLLPTTTISTIYLIFQVLFIIAGISFFIFFLDMVSYTIIFLLFILFIFMLIFNKNILSVVVRYLPYKVNPQIFNYKNIMKVFMYLCITWFLWSVSFYLFLLSNNINISLHIALLFPLSATIGILAFFAPGGLGVREGTLILLLSFFKIDSGLMYQISIDSRIWFLIGEFSIFIIGLFSFLIFKILKKGS